MKRIISRMVLAFVCVGISTMPVSAQWIAENTYRVCENDIFVGAEGVKKIVTEVNDDGTFIAEDIGVWIDNHDMFRKTVVKEEGSVTEYYYEYDLEDHTGDFPATDTSSYLDVLQLVREGDLIRASSEGAMEIVTSVEASGSFYTEECVYDGMLENESA